MKWPWQKDEIEVPEDNREEAHRALQKSKKDLAKARQRDAEVSSIARSLEEIRRKNHLAEQLRQALGGQ